MYAKVRQAKRKRFESNNPASAHLARTVEDLDEAEVEQEAELELDGVQEEEEAREDAQEDDQPLAKKKRAHSRISFQGITFDEDDVFVNIISYLPIESVLALLCVSKKYSSIESNSSAWEAKCKRHFPHKYKDFVSESTSDEPGMLEGAGEQKMPRSSGSQVEEHPVSWFKQFHLDAFETFWVVSKDNRALRIAVIDADIETIRAQIKRSVFRLKDLDVYKFWLYPGRSNTLLQWMFLQNVKPMVTDTIFQELVIPFYRVKQSDENAQEVDVFDIEKVDDNEQTILHHAVKFGNKKLVEDLINRGASVNAQDKFQKTALFHAISFNRFEMVEFLLTVHDIHVNIRCCNGDTVLSHAASLGADRVVSLLLNHPGIGVNIKNDFGETALITGIYRDGFSDRDDQALKVVQALLADERVRVNTSEADDECMSPLESAIYMEHLAIIELLLSHEREKPVDVLRLFKVGNYASLYLKYYPVDQVDVNGYTALTAAASGNYAMENVLKLLAGGADVTLRNAKGDTALICAARSGHAGCVEVLLGKMTDAQVVLSDSNGLTALMHAAERGHEGCVTVLLAKMCDVLVANEDGQTTLIYEGQLFELFKMVIENETLAKGSRHLLAMHRLIEVCKERQLDVEDCYLEALHLIPPNSIYYLWSRYELAKYYFGKEDGDRESLLKEANRYLLKIPRNPVVTYPEELPEVYKILEVSREVREMFAKAYIYEGIYSDPVHDERARLPDVLELSVETNGIISNRVVEDLMKCLEAEKALELQHKSLLEQQQEQKAESQSEPRASASSSFDFFPG